VILPLLEAHLQRLGAIGVVSMLAAAWIMRTQPDPWGRGFAMMTLAWTLFNAIIIAVSWMNRTEPATASFREFLAFNLGLNFAYIGVGIALWRLGRPAVSGAGAAASVQGAALLALDLLLWSEVT
jgi:hypothetical protein